MSLYSFKEHCKNDAYVSIEPFFQCTVGVTIKTIYRM